MAAKQPLERQPRSSCHAEALDRLVCIQRTRGLKPAASAHEQRQVRLIESQRPERQAHARCPWQAVHALGIRRNNSASSAANSAFATLLFGCMTMSHPAGISRRWQRTTSRTRRRMRLRTTAPPSAFLMLNPKRLCGSWFARKKTVKWEFERRFPARYTASNSPRRTSRASRGKSRRLALYGSEPMTALLAACRKHSAASGGLHARSETVRLGAPALSRLIGALWQSNPPYILRIAASQISGCIPQAASAALCESVSVVDPRAHGQESGGIAYRAGKSDTPAFHHGDSRCARYPMMITCEIISESR